MPEHVRLCPEHLSRRIRHRRAVKPRTKTTVEADQTVDTPATPGAPFASHQADVAEACMCQPRWIASDRADCIADAWAGTRRAPGHRQGAAGEAHRGEIGAGVNAAHRALHLLAIGQHQRNA